MADDDSGHICGAVVGPLAAKFSDRVELPGRRRLPTWVPTAESQIRPA